MKKKLKKLVSMAAAVAMTVSMLTVNAFAIDIDKTADSKLDEKNQTTVTLSVGGTQTVENVAVLFVLDYSTSVEVRDAAGTFLTELASKENTNVKAAVVDYSSVAAATDWTVIDKDTDTDATDGLLSSQTSSGTNYQAGLLKAQELLTSPEIAGYTTYLITISDGITYLWTDETSDKTMTVPYAMVGSNDTVSAADGSLSVWDMTYHTGTPLISTETTDGVYEDWDSFFIGVAGKLTATEQYFVEYKTDYSSYIAVYNSDNKNYDNGNGNTETLATYDTNVEIAVYETISAYQELATSADYAFAFKMDENHWSSYPFGEQLMDYLIGVSDNSGDTASGEISDTTASTVFSTIQDQILYEIMSGTVTDVIGGDFDWVGMDTVKLTVGGVEVTGTVDESNSNIIYFGTANDGVYPYVVTYYPEDATSGESEYFIWEINVPVEATAGLTLSYDLVLSDDYVLPENGHDVLDTNESADITYEDPDGEEKTEEFPVPEVVIGGEKISEPGLDKTIVVTSEDEDGNTVTTEVDRDDVAAGDRVSFVLDSTIPETLSDHIIYSVDDEGNLVGTVNSTTTADEVSGQTTTIVDTYDLVFHDEMATGLELDENTIVVTINGHTLDPQYYTVAIAGATDSTISDNCTFEVSVELLALYTAGIIDEDDFGYSTITVTYTATLSEEAEAGSYTNTAWVSFEDTTSEKDKVEVDTYKLSIYKYDQSVSDGNSYTKGLQGATFRLLQEAEEDVDTTRDDVVQIDGTYYVVIKADVTSDEDGYATIDGLDAGTYYLQETEAPHGYVASEALVEVVISADEADASFAFYALIANAPIPSTGGMGTTIFRVVGMTLLLAAGAVYVVSLRRKKEEA